MTYIISAAAIALWIWLLTVLRKAGLRFWRYLLGSCGIFLIFMIIIRPWAVLPLARIVAAIAGIFGKVSGFYQAYFRYGVIAGCRKAAADVDRRILVAPCFLCSLQRT